MWWPENSVKKRARLNDRVAEIERTEKALKLILNNLKTEKRKHLKALSRMR